MRLPGARVNLPRPKGLPKPEGASREETARIRAEKLVAQFNSQLEILQQMRDEWADKYPHARQELDHIKQQEDEVDNYCSKAKSAVSAAKVSIGDFHAQRKFKKAYYDPKEVADISRRSSDVEQVLLMLIRDNVVTAIDLDSDAALTWFAQRPQYSQMFHDAFRDQEEMTTAVKVPRYK